ncbi:MAG: PFL family protein [Planctomycetes bacterium]|nr:PFL family protein [Planctomycetota bacterium]
MQHELEEIFQTLRMIESESFDIRTVTMGISLLDCADRDMKSMAERIEEKIYSRANNLRQTVRDIQSELGIPIVNCRLSTTPVAMIAGNAQGDVTLLAKALDRAAERCNVNYIGGFGATVEKGFTEGDYRLIEAIPEALDKTQRVCSNVAVASTKAGINMDAVLKMGKVVRDAAWLSADRGGINCAKLVVFCNIPTDNPFVAGAMHLPSEADTVINVGISGPGVVRGVLARLGPDRSLTDVAEAIKNTSFKITRAGELVGREAARRLDVQFGVIDLSLAPTPAEGDSVADILELIGVEKTGAHGTTVALALLTDAIKKGGAMATSSFGGLSGSFIPVSEDAGMIRAVQAGALSIDKLEAMTSVCSVGLDMVAIPGDTSVEKIAAIIADQMAIGVINFKTTAARLLPIPGKGPGETYDYGGLLGTAIVQEVNKFGSDILIHRAGRVPPPIHSLRN